MRFRSFWPAVFWSALILVLSFSSGKSFPSADWMDWFKLDKWIHAFLYFTLFLTLYIPINKRKLGRHSLWVSIALIYSLAIGLFTELIQAFFLTDRSGDVPDMIANSVGVSIAVILIRIYDRKWAWKTDNE